MSRIPVRFWLNGKPVNLEVAPHETLLQSLRDRALATEVKYGCGEGVCGTCTIPQWETVSSCLILAVQADGCEIATVRSLGGGRTELHPLQEAFVRHGAAQCGFCTPGMLLAAHELLRHNPSPTREQIRKALEGNLCRCTGYHKIIDAVEDVARARAEG